MNSLLQMYLERITLEPLAFQELNTDGSAFWRNLSGFINPLDVRTIRNYCDWASAVKEVNAIVTGLKFIYKHAQDDSNHLNTALREESRSYSRRLIEERLQTLREKQIFIRGLIEL